MSMKQLFFVLIILLCVSFSKAQAQSIPAISDARISQIQQALNLSAQSGKLLGVAQKYDFHGKLEYQLAYKKGGKVLHCRNLHADTQDNLFLSRFQMQILKEKVPVKVKKGEQLKLTHTFQFQ
jgi:hypothetical protein